MYGSVCDSVCVCVCAYQCICVFLCTFDQRMPLSFISVGPGEKAHGHDSYVKLCTHRYDGRCMYIFVVQVFKCTSRKNNNGNNFIHGLCSFKPCEATVWIICKILFWPACALRPERTVVWTMNEVVGHAVANIVPVVNILFLQEQYHSQRMHYRVTPSLIKETAGFIEVVEERLVLFASEE